MPDFLVALILRKDQTLVPDGNTVIEEGDSLWQAEQFEDRDNLSMKEINLSGETGG